MKYLNLFRGLASADFQVTTRAILQTNRAGWMEVIKRRARGDFTYPAPLDQTIQSLHRSVRLEYQYFTDRQEIAEEYARTTGGTLVGVRVPMEDVQKYFDLEFQNFSRRKQRFEIVYRVKGATLARFSKRWKLSTRRTVK